MLRGLARSPAALQPLVFLFLLPPLLRRQALIARGQGRRAGLRGPWRGKAPCWGSAGASTSRVEFAPPDRSGWRGSRLSLEARLHSSRSGLKARLKLSRSGLAGGLPMPLPRLAGKHGLSWPRLGRDSRLALCGPRCHRFEGLGFARDKPLVRGQLMNPLHHLRRQRHGSLGGQGRTRQTPARSDRHRLNPGNLGLDRTHTLGRRQEVWPVQVGLSHPEIVYRTGRR